MARITGDVCAVNYPPKVYGRTAEEVERVCQGVVERIFRDRDGLIRSGVNGRTMRPLEEKDAPDRPGGQGCYTECAGTPRRFRAVWLNYENAGQASGKYIRAMLAKAAVARDPRALARARRTFQALVFLWNNVAEQHSYGRGWMPKPYAGPRDVAEQFECSVDQYADITLGLDAFHRAAASPAERQTIKEMVLSFADWWMEHDYTAGYMGYCCYWKRLEYAHPIGYFLYLNALAYSFLPKRKYLDAFNQWMEISGGLSAPKKQVCINGNGLALECLQRLIELRPERRAHWRLCARVCLDNMIALSQKKYNYPRTRVRMQLNGYLAHHLVAAHAIFPGEGIEKRIAELLASYRKREDFYHLSRGLKLSDLDPRVAGGDYRNTFWAEGHICWLNAYWSLKRPAEQEP